MTRKQTRIARIRKRIAKADTAIKRWSHVRYATTRRATQRLAERKLEMYEDRRDLWEDRLVQSALTPEFFHQSEEKHAHAGEKYMRLDVGSSGAWMLDMATGDIFGIKGYGKVDKKKIAGNITDPEFNGKVLFRDRFRYGRFDNRKAAS